MDRSIGTSTRRFAEDRHQCSYVLCKCSGLAEVTEHRIDELEGSVDLLAYLGSSEHDFAFQMLASEHIVVKEGEHTRYEDEQDDPRLHHSIDQTREKLRFVGRESMMARSKTLQSDRELDVTAADDVLDLEVLERSVETELLNNTRILATRKAGIILGLSASDHYAMLKMVHP